jgi:hypothetical protein
LSDTSVVPGTPPAPPANAQEARTRLSAFVADNGKGAKLLSGDVETNREFTQLTAMASGEDASTVAAAMAGNVAESPSSSVKLMADIAGMLREIGIREEIIEQTLKGHEVSAEEYKLVEAYKSRLFKDPTFVRSFLSNDQEAKQKIMLISIIESGGIQGRSGSSF